MDNVLVHQAKPTDNPNVRIILDSIAGAFSDLGYNVIRWRSACGDPFPYNTRFTHSIIFGGNANWTPPIKLYLTDIGTDRMYVEVDDFGIYRKQKSGDDLTFILNRGLCPWSPTIGGVCGFRDWAGTFKPIPSGIKVKVRSGYLLVCLQDNVNLQNHREASPLFNSNDGFVQHVVANSHIPVRIRKHPDYPLTSGVLSIVENSANGEWDDSPDIEVALDGAAALACIDSHVGVRAILRNLPVMCYGRALYRMPGVSWRCITAEDTITHTEELKFFLCNLDKGAQDSFIEKCRKETWRLSDLPRRLKDYLEKGNTGEK